MTQSANEMLGRATVTLCHVLHYAICHNARHRKLSKFRHSLRSSDGRDDQALAAVANVSARSVFRHFKKIYGYSPQEFIQRVRLKRARVMLLDQGWSASVMSIALKCGFQSTGYFARVYRQHFGELPSDTLRASSFLRDASVRQI